MRAMSGFFARLARLEAERRPFVLCTVTDTGGSTPRLAGAQMAVAAAEQHGTVGGGAFEWRVVQDARALLADPARTTAAVDVHLVRDLGMCCGGRMTAFLQKVESAPRVWIFGAGHVGAALAEMARRVGFEVVVADPRPEWAAPARFPEGVRVLDVEPEDLVRAEPPAPADYVVITTHDHALDEALVRKLAAHELTYIGLVGSRGKWGRFRKRLRERVPAAALDRVRCPVGLDIGAATPEEIALSIVGEMVARRRGAVLAPKPAPVDAE
jgi:xanthine dehydrogenase accessory factor